MATSGQKTRSGAKSSSAKGAQQRRRPHQDETGIIPVLARVVRGIENAAERGKVNAANRVRYRVVAVLAREERARIKGDASITDAERTKELTRLDGIATIMAKTAARDASLIQLLTDTAPLSPSAQEVRRTLLIEAGTPLAPEDLVVVTEPEQKPAVEERQVVPQSVRQYQMSNPFLAPDFSAYQTAQPSPRGDLDSWELIEPLFRSFEIGAGGGAASMELPEARSLATPGGLELMRHQARFVESAREGHRSYLLADEPGLGKTAQALLAADVAKAYPLLVVVPNVVKVNWAREVDKWTPHRSATVVHGDGDDIDAFADVVIVNYEVLDRHVAWLSRRGFRGMIVDEAHFIKNKESQRSKNVQALSRSIRQQSPNPLLVALTGTPLINQIEDFRMIWQFLGWIDEKKPMPRLMEALEETELTPVDPGFFAAARRAVVGMGIVRRKKVDVAADIPARRIADIPVELDGEAGRSIREAERALVARLVERFRRLRSSRPDADAADLVRLVAAAELEESKQTQSGGDNVFTMVRRIGQAKATPAADYTVNLARNVGKVVFFAKHIDVMDAAEAHFAKAGLRTVSIRGDQTSKARQAEIDAFQNDPDVAVAVCSLTAAGVGVNLQAASNVVLAELSWTNAEQTQAIDRVHRIGQELPVTAWRIIAAQTIDGRIAELIDSKAGLAARALDGDTTEATEGSVQLEALVALLSDAIREL
ncbi:DEAD/DEAH box helicase [Protaetiibacter mangrovi]|uniref:DEAD/DEAH box helicase n=1 Tax=Protaetiibacter mangrovi TaxID=2970926 RepID=A0ABT1ZBD2_9MICO|nr:DEAD/DEAH box helicase [Protaetiibacter mangrovi]MCS0498001.1 DEAD/DEAH box helicase [Protaetiibacter mangrovi]TPX02420.1 DEAD/DEAH box helicase [Schumannella luteola]